MTQQNTINRVKSTLAGFEHSYLSLPHNQLIPVRKELMARLGWSISVFYYKKRGDTPIWEHEVEIINEIFNRFGIKPAA